MLNRSILSRTVSSVKNWDVFTLTEKMANLKISDTDIPSSSSRSIDSPVYVCTNTKGILDRFLKQIQHSDLTRSVIDRTKSAFIDIPNSICDITSKSTGYFLSLGFRFLPGQDSFLTKSLSLPDTVESLIDLKNQLGLSLSKDSLTNMAKIKYNTLTDQASTIYSLWLKLLHIMMGIMVDSWFLFNWV